MLPVRRSPVHGRTHGLVRKMLLLLTIFAAGIVVDTLVAKYTIAVSGRRPLAAANFSALLALVNLGVIGTVLEAGGEQLALSALAYAAGNWLGTYVITKPAKTLKGKRI